MKLLRLMATTGIALVLFSCGSKKNSLVAINSASFQERQITLDSNLMRRLLDDSLLDIRGNNIQTPNTLTHKIDEMILMAENVRTNQSDSSWVTLLARWDDFRKNEVGAIGIPVIQSPELPDSMENSAVLSALQKWAELNVRLVKLTGEAKFSDVLEKLLYETKTPVLPEKFIKSVIYTHIDDRIFINIIGSSSIIHNHTTGGTVKLIQETDYPASNEMTLKCESGDIRFMDVFIRIPSWAINPTVTHGNVKYVARSGEYCEISRKWANGDEIRVALKN